MSGVNYDENLFEATENAVVNETAGAYGSDSLGDDFMFEIVEHLGIMRKNARGWTRELNIVSWNGHEARYDIRDWSEDHSKMSRGITMSREEAGMIYRWLTPKIKEMLAEKKKNSPARRPAEGELPF